jgi:hypothetical protein
VCVCPGSARRYDGTTVASPATANAATKQCGVYACVPSAISPPRMMEVAAVRSNAAVYDAVVPSRAVTSTTVLPAEAVRVTRRHAPSATSATSVANGLTATLVDQTVRSSMPAFWYMRTEPYSPPPFRRVTTRWEPSVASVGTCSQNDTTCGAPAGTMLATVPRAWDVLSSAADSRTRVAGVE